jgi:putative nucleotidyltransferase with HDIG domain
MIRKIKQEDLRPGMYVHKLGISWIDHPFFRNHFKIKDISDIKKIWKAGVKVIYIDTEKGVDVKSAPVTEQPVISVEPEPENKTLIEQSYTPVTVAEEMQKARQVKQEAKRVISDIMSDIRLGKQVDTERISPVVEQMLGSIFRNQDALLGLTRIRNMDQYTFEHSISVSALMIAFAKKLGLDESTIWEVGVGGILHDIGKLQVPDRILNKPGRLSDDEFSVMRRHVRFGSRLLDDAEAIPSKALQVVKQHHERIDGSGYPDNLSGVGISLYGKMASIVDVYDAITSERVYHKAKLPNIVLRQLIEWSEKGQFDTELVQHFIRCVGIYPVGTLVALQSGRLAVVVSQSQETLLTPTLNVVYDLRKNRFLTPRFLNLARPGADSDERIIKPVSPEPYRIRIAEYLSG